MPSDTAQLLQRAIAHHQTGQFDEAEQLYRAILLVQPDHPEANHNIGTLALQKKQPLVAQAHFLKALEANPSNVQYWLSHINSLLEAGQLEAAREVMTIARKIGLHGNEIDAMELRLKDLTSADSGSGKPDQLSPQSEKDPSQRQIDSLIALYNQGRLQEAEVAARAMTARFPSHSFGWSTLGVVLQQLGRSEEALSPMQKAVALTPKDAQSHSNLGNTLSYLGRLKEAEASFRSALKIDRNFAEAHLNLGATLHDMKRFKEAEACYRAAIRIKPGLSNAHYNLGNTLKSLGRLEEAEASYKKALQINPGLVGAYNNLGLLLQAAGKMEEAEITLRKALQLDPDSIEARNSLGSTLHELGRLKEARHEYESALLIKPDHADILSNLGSTLHDLGDLAGSETSYRKAIVARPDFARACSNLGTTLQDMGRLDEAVDFFRRALEIDPDYLKARSNLLFSLNHSLKFSPEDCLAEARDYGRIVSSKVTSKYRKWPVAPHPERLRIGLVSADFRNHPVGYFLENVLGQLSSSKLELFAYPTYHKTDELTARIRPLFSGWKPLYGKSDEAAAAMIHSDRVHILIDLSGHTQHNRLPVFAWKPAPVQLSWLGYFATTGIAEIDYILGDPHVAPDSEAAHFTENIWQLPECYWCFSEPRVQVDVNPLPALQNGHITFGCFNNLTKMNDAVVVVWAKILHAVPGSRLFLKYSQLDDPSICSTTLERYARLGIANERLILEGSSSRAEYLACYHRVDIALDPFPYPGGTTSMESLWMGVPIVSLRGNSFLSHAAETIAHNAGQSEWIACDEEDYVAKAMSFSSDLGRLAGLRARLRNQVVHSPLFDAPRFARHFEQAMWKIWTQWQERGKS